MADTKTVAIAGLGDVAKFLVEEFKKTDHKVVLISREVVIQCNFTDYRLVLGLLRAATQFAPLTIQ